MKAYLTLSLASLLLIALSSCNPTDSGPRTDAVKESCVRFVSFKDGRIASLGSGFIISNKGHVVTNNHVTAGAEKIYLLHRMGGKIRLFSASLLKSDIEADLSVVGSSLKGPPLTMNLSPVAIKSEVDSYGFPGVADARQDVVYRELQRIIQNKEGDPDLNTQGIDITGSMSESKLLAQLLEPSVNSGNVSRLAMQPLVQVTKEGKIKIVLTGRKDSDGNPLIDVDRSGRPIHIVEHTARIGHGNSGGPLLDRAGYVIGVVGQNNQEQGDKVEFAISGKEELRQFLEGVGIPITAVNIDMSGKWTRTQMILISLASATLLVAAGLGLTLLTKRRPATVNMPTAIFRRRMEEFMNNGQGGAGNHQQPPGANGNSTSLPVSPSGVAWELDITGEGGFSQRVSLTDEDFIKGRGRVILGRNADFSGVTVKHDSVSRQHLHFELKSGSLFVADRNSSNGTKVNNVRLSAPFRDQALKEGDQMDFGQVTATLRRRF
jgi:hypothetical protein